MAEQWQIRRGTTAENDDFTGAVGELTMDINKNQIRLHDGSTQGGIEIPSANTADYVVEWQGPTNEDKRWYRKYKSGWVEQGGRTNNGIFLIQMRDMNYSAIVSPLDMYAGERQVGNEVIRSSTTKVTFQWGNTSSSDLSWEVKGWAA